MTNAPEPPAPPRPLAPSGGRPIRVLLLILAAAATAPLIALTVLRSVGEFHNTRELTRITTMKSAREVADEVDHYLGELNLILQVAERSVSLSPSSVAANDRALQLYKRDLPAWINNLGLWRTDGVNIGSSRDNFPIQNRYDVADRRYFREAMRTGKTSAGDPVVSRSTGEWSIAIARPLLDKSGRVQAVLSGSTMLRKLSEQMNSGPGLPAGAVVTILTREGLIVARSQHGERWIGHDVSRDSVMRLVIASDGGAITATDLDGVRRLSGYAPVTQAPWLVIVGIPESQSMAAPRQGLLDDALVLAATLGICLVLVLLLSARLADPITRLTTDVLALEAGDLSRRTTVAGSRETRHLAHGFNAMAEALQRRAQSLEDARVRERALFEQNPTPMWVFDRETLRVLDVNETALSRYGYARAEFMALTVDQLRHPEARSEFDATLRRGAALPQHAVGLVTHRTREGAPLAVEIFASSIEFHGRHARLVLAVDAEERERLRAQLQQSQKIESIGRLAGGVAHDFNNILTVILSSVHFAQEQVGDDGAAAPELAEIALAAQRAAALTRQLLSFARRDVITPRALDLNVVIADTDRLLRRLLGEQIELVTLPADDLWHAHADPGQIEQVIMNLAINARDAMGGHGRLIVETANVELDDAYGETHPYVVPGAYVMLSVTDTGPGIPSEVAAHIFEPFYTTKNSQHGTGLGLSVCYGIARQNRGSIEVYSEAGHGATFKVYLPRTDAVPVPEPAPTAPATARGTETILLVEDNDGVRRVSARTLRDGGFTVLEAEDGPQALALAAAFDGVIHLIVTDVVMPHMNGPLLARQLVRARPGLRVLFSSGYTVDAMVRNGEIDRGIWFLPKPHSGPALLDKVRTVLDASS